MIVTILGARGIGEKIDNTLCNRELLPHIKNELEKLGFFKENELRYIEVAWNAIYGPVGGKWNEKDYDTNVKNGERLVIQDYIDVTSDLIVLVGYSAGATLMGNVAATIPWATRKKIICVGLVSDPRRPIGGGMPNYTAPNYGVGGERKIDTNMFSKFWAADPADMITSLEKDSLIRPIADITYAVSFDQGEFPGWLADLADKAVKNTWQKVLFEPWKWIETSQQIKRAKIAAEGYLTGGDHVSYNSRKVPGEQVTYLESLGYYIAHEINNRVLDNAKLSV